MRRGSTTAQRDDRQEHGDRQRSLAPDLVHAGRGGPDHRFEAHELSRQTLDARRAHQVDRPVLHHGRECHARQAHHLDLHLRIGRRKLLEDRRQQGRGIVVGHAEHDPAGDVGPDHRGPGFVAQGQHAPRVAEQDLAVLRRRDAARPADEQRLAERGLERLDLHAHRRLRAVDDFGRAADVAGIGHRDDHGQDVQVECFHRYQKIR